MLIDSHCHFNSLSKISREEVISSLQGKYRFIDSSIDVDSSLASLDISKEHKIIHSSLGFHPFSISNNSDTLISQYEKMIDSSNKVIAIGEIGLDSKAEASLEEQEDILTRFLDLAKRRKLPVIIHNRLDDDRILRVLDNFFTDYKRVVFHCFSYSVDFLSKILRRGGFVSFSLNILRKNNDLLLSLKKCPEENILLETDSPYMRIKGQPSTPLDILKVYVTAAKVKQMDQSHLECAVLSNMEKVFFPSS